jgi:DNA polymerase III subunit gamma/tau
MLERAGASQSGEATTTDLAQRFSLQDLAAHAQRFAEIDFNIKHSPFPQLPLEIAIVSATTSPGATASAPDRQAAQQPAGAMPRAFEPAAPPRDEAQPAPRVTSLRDRVRNPAASREAISSPPREPASAESQPPRVEPAPITPLRSAPAPAAPQPAAAASPGGAGLYDVAQIADLWPRIRSDVKAINRRIEALLSEVDPVAISESEVTLAVPYPFHRDKLNSDEVRDTVADVLSRNLGRRVTIACVLRGEFVPAAVSTQPAPRAATQSTAADPIPSVGQEAAPPDLDPGDDADEARLQAARNLLDADEIDEEEFVRLYGDAAST